jgi:hypothetical protein
VKLLKVALVVGAAFYVMKNPERAAITLRGLAERAIVLTGDLIAAASVFFERLLG